MDWSIQDLGALGEFVGSIGVIATLIYLAIQIRQNTDSVRESNLRTQTDRSIGHSRFSAGTPGMMARFQQAQTDSTKLTDEQRWQFGTFLYSMCLDFQEQFFLHKRSRLDEAFWQTMNKNMTRYLRGPGGREWWQSGQQMLDDEFVAYVNDLLS
jgi:hypothetical protein